MARTTKVLGFSVPPEVAKAFEEMAQHEHRTKSELFREMFRVYQRYRSRQSEYDEGWITQMSHEVKENPVMEE